MTKSINHTCGHSTSVEIDDSVKARITAYKAQKCFTCQPTQSVICACGHEEQLERGFQFSPRRVEMAAMRNCADCQ